MRELAIFTFIFTLIRGHDQAVTRLIWLLHLSGMCLAFVRKCVVHIKTWLDKNFSEATTPYCHLRNWVISTPTITASYNFISSALCTDKAQTAHSPYITRSPSSVILFLYENTEHSIAFCIFLSLLFILNKIDLVTARKTGKEFIVNDPMMNHVPIHYLSDSGHDHVIDGYKCCWTILLLFILL